MTSLWTAEVRHAERAGEVAREAELARSSDPTDRALAGQLAELLRLVADLIDSEPPAPRGSRGRLAGG